MLCNDYDSAQRVLNAVKQSNRVVLDVETSGIKRFSNHVVGWVLTVGPSPSDTFYVPVRHAGGGNLSGCTVSTTEDGWDRTIHPWESELARYFGVRPKQTSHRPQLAIRSLVF